MKAGDYIRSYDFEPLLGRGQCYLEGTITRVADGYVFFTVENEVWNGTPMLASNQGSRIGSECSAPLQGVEEFDGRLQVLHS